MFLRPDVFEVLAETLLSCIKFPTVPFADEFKFIEDSAVHSKAEIHAEIDTAAAGLKICACLCL